MILLKCLWARIRNFFGFHKDTSVIPEGQYCYTPLGYEEGYNPFGYKESTLKIKVCPYFKSLGGMKSACLYTGFYGEDLIHWDQCKICGEKMEERAETLELVAKSNSINWETYHKLSDMKNNGGGRLEL